jgi:LPS-assembly lipoprotein
MLLFNRRNALLGALALTLPLGACGFSPVYQDNANLRGAFEFNAPSSRVGFVLTKQLEDRLGRASNAKYDLKMTPSISQRTGAISTSNVRTRFIVTGRVGYQIRLAGTDTVLKSGSADSFTSYSATGSTIATASGSDAAQDRVMVLLADQLVGEIYAIAPQLP